MKLLVVLICLHVTCHEALALDIVKPGEGERITAGTEMEVIMEPRPGEEWKELILQLSPLKDQAFSDGLRGTISIPSDMVGEHYLIVVAVDRSGMAVLLQRTVLIMMPDDVELKCLSVFPEQITLYKMSHDCPPADRIRFETEEINVYGNCSDGIRRKLISPASGTAYMSGDETVASVSDHGVVIAQGVGTTTITVVNGECKAKTSVEVKPCLQK